MIPNTTARAVYTGDGVTTGFAFNGIVLKTTDIVVTEVVIASGLSTVLSLGGSYTIEGTPDSVGRYINGVTVRATVAPPATVQWVIYQDPSVTQDVDLTDNGLLPVESQIELPLDRLTVIAQRTRNIIARSLRQPDSDPADISTLPNKPTRANQFLAFDSNGNPIAAAGTSANLNPVSAFVDTLLSSGDGNSFLGKIGTMPSDPRVVINTQSTTDRRGILDFQRDGSSLFIIALDLNLGNISELSFRNVNADTVPLRITSTSDLAVDGRIDMSLSTQSNRGQIKFPVTQNASSDANTLDDYEEGPWTLSLGGTTTYTNRVGRYTKIGRMVFITGQIQVNTLGTGSTSIITGLPFTASSLMDFPISIGFFSGLATSVVALYGRVGAAGTSVQLFGASAAATGNTAVSNLFGNSTAVSFSAAYMVD